MPYAAALLAEFDHEMGNTRRALERLPQDKLDWRPHEKSMSIGDLATHIADLPRWGVRTMAQTEFDLAPVDGHAPRLEAKDSVEDLLAAFDENVAQARAAIEAASDEDFEASWSLLMHGKAVFTMPRIAVLRSMIMNHVIHHRGQLSVYLRLNDVPVPPIYGPTADEQPG